MAKLTKEQAQYLEALKAESPALFRINLKIVLLGGQPIPLRRPLDPLDRRSNR